MPLPPRWIELRVIRTTPATDSPDPGSESSTGRRGRGKAARPRTETESGASEHLRPWRWPRVAGRTDDPNPPGCPGTYAPGSRTAGRSPLADRSEVLPTKACRRHPRVRVARALPRRRSASEWRWPLPGEHNRSACPLLVCSAPPANPDRSRPARPSPHGWPVRCVRERHRRHRRYRRRRTPLRRRTSDSAGRRAGRHGRRCRRGGS